MMQITASRPGFKRFVAVLAVAGLVLPAAPGTAQQTFSETTDVVAVEIPVQVTKDGEPVRGLTAADFEVFDGRKKVPITGFEVLDLATITEPGAAAAEVPISGRRHFMVLFDLSFSEPRTIFKARSAAQDVLKGLHPTDLVAVATYSTLQGTQLVLGFTPDRQQIASAIDTLGAPQLVDRSADPLRLVLTETVGAMINQPQQDANRVGEGVKENTEAALLENLEGLTASSERADRSAREQQLRTMTKSFQDLARLMGEVDGRKYVVYLSEGFDSALISGKTQDDPDTQAVEDAASNDRMLTPTEGSGMDSQFGSTSSLNAVEKMLEEFRRADCQIQAVDIGGLRASTDLGYQRKGGKDALFQMAKSTGGDLYENFNDLSVAMGQMLRRTGVTYVLSFQPDKLKYDGSFHKLKVEVKNARGARLVYRQGWYEPLPYKEQPVMQRLLETANQVMGEESGSVVASVLAAPFAAAGERAHVPVVIEVDGPSLLTGKQDPQLPVEIYIYALDQNGGVTDFVTQTVGIDLAKAEPTLRQAGLKFFANFQLPPGKYSIRTLVRNGVTGNSSLRVTELEVPAFAKGEPELLPAIFQDTSPARWVNLRQAKKAGEPDPPYLFMIKDQPYVPTSRPALGAGQDLRVVLQGYNLGAGDWKAEAKVLSADGKEVPGGALQLVDKEAGAGAGPTRMVAAFRPPSLPPGEYMLQVTLTNGAGKSETSTAWFAVGAARGARG